MNVALIESVDEFLAETSALRAADPLRTNVIGSVALSVSTGRSAYDHYHWWVVRDNDGDVVGVAIRTSPFNMILAPMPFDAAHELGRRAADVDDALPGISGPKDVLDAFVDGYVQSQSPGSRRLLSEERRDLLYELEELITPDVEGVGRVARAEETEPIATMLIDFFHEVAITPLSPTDARENIKKSIAAGALFCWEVDGVIAAFAGHAPVVTTGSILLGRVGPVYTPPSYRGRGFGSAVTAHVTRHLIEKGARVMLFTDAANPTSNSIYQAIGYRLVDEFVQMRFD
jgi:ribosomal protein S18 acetylase RimI-like enzyme